MTPDMIWKIASIGGATGILALVVWAFITNLVMTREQVAVLVKAVSDGKDREIALLTRERDDYRDMANRNSGSQQVQAAAVRELGDAILTALATNKAAAP